MEGLNPEALKIKSLSLHWELMFTRATLSRSTPCSCMSGVSKMARLVETGRVRTTAQIAMGRIDAANLTRAHALVESGKTFGKVVLEGF